MKGQRFLFILIVNYHSGIQIVYPRSRNSTEHFIEPNGQNSDNTKHHVRLFVAIKKNKSLSCVYT